MNRTKLICLVFCAAMCGASLTTSAEVQFVVGDLLKSEGGDWDPDSSPLSSPFGIDFAPDGTMLIVELYGGRVHQIDADGKLTHISGDGSKSYHGDGGPIKDATYNGMHNCAVTKNGDLYIADSWNHCVRKVDHRDKTISTIAGTGEAGFSGDGGPASKATFNFVMCITLNHDETQLHIADLKNRRVRDVDLQTGIVRTVAGNGKAGKPSDGSRATESPLVDPRAVASDSKGNLYILERGGQALRVVDRQGAIRTVAGNGKKGHKDGDAMNAMLGSPKHLCVDRQDRVLIADDQNRAIRLYDPESHKMTTVLGRGFGDKRIQLSKPHGVCWEDDWLYVIDTGHNRILRMRL